jgi:hypothetical protein
MSAKQDEATSLSYPQTLIYFVAYEIICLMKVCVFVSFLLSYYLFMQVFL